MRTKKFTINDNDRDEFCRNYEYLWYQYRVAKNKRNWIINNRALIDAIIISENAKNNK